MTSINCPPGFSLGATLTSGQCFRWQSDGDGYTGTAFGRRVRLEQRAGEESKGSKGGEIIITGDDGDSDGDDSKSDGEDGKGDGDGGAALWREYLDLDTDYDAILAEILSIDPRLREGADDIIAKTGGVRILRQEPWEALCSFVISQNNNIGRIRLIIGRLCGKTRRFPSPEEVASLSEQELVEIGCGYRAAYILAAARAVVSGQINFDRLRSLPLDEARAELMSVRGIGPKVADCALLYGLHRLECFPRDVWIKRALSRGLVSEAVARSRYAGVAQQYIFEYIRSKHNV
ncbi:MAG: DNA-3-methyladenine glycosylase 2 family protein [Oscillospiraceae bacterium]|nr:DNA-3-methyladenine glycosylase 2 family protein [Oscillospiraceae bacterium]